MRFRKRHAWSAVLIALFVLPVLKPDGFPETESRVDAFLGWPARLSAGNPHGWSATDDSSSTTESVRVRALEQVLISEREQTFRVLDELAQRGQLAQTLGDLGRKPLALTARILRARDASSTRRSILVDLGSADGVEVGDAVAQGRVFVGTVAHVSPHAARVQLVTDPPARYEVAVRTTEGARATAWLRGGDDDELPLRNLRAHEGLHVRPGDAVVTSNGDERIPAGLVVGSVVRASDDEGDAILSVRIRPAMELGRSTSVLVLKPAP